MVLEGGEKTYPKTKELCHLGWQVVQAALAADVAGRYQ